MDKSSKQYSIHNGIVEITERQEQQKQQKLSTPHSPRMNLKQERDNALALLRETKEQFARVNKMRSDVLSILSHEFRTALATIHDFSELICDERASIPDMRELAADIRADSRRLTHTIHDILERDRLESENIYLSLDWLDLNAIIKDAVEHVHPLAGQHNIRLYLAHLLPVLQGDSDKLTQIITYLLNNVSKYAPHGGDISIKSSVERHIVRVSIQHHARGSSNAAASALHSASTSRVSVEASMMPLDRTLSLREAQQITRLHGGQLWSEHIPGESPTFHFTLRVAHSVTR